MSFTGVVHARSSNGIKISSHRTQVMLRQITLFPTYQFCNTFIYTIFLTVSRMQRLGPVHTYPDIFMNPQLFLSGFGLCPHVSGKSGIQSHNWLRIRSPEWKFLNALWIVRTLNLDIFLSDDLTRSSPVNTVFKMATSMHVLLAIFPEES